MNIAVFLFWCQAIFATMALIKRKFTQWDNKQQNDDHQHCFKWHKVIMTLIYYSDTLILDHQHFYFLGVVNAAKIPFLQWMIDGIGFLNSFINKTFLILSLHNAQRQYWPNFAWILEIWNIAKKLTTKWRF